MKATQREVEKVLLALSRKEQAFSAQFSKLYAFPVGANGDALLADYLEDPSETPPEKVKPLPLGG